MMMMMMMMMRMMMNCFCGIVDQQKTLFSARTTNRDSHHHKSPTRCQQDLNLCTTEDFDERSFPVVITTTPHNHKYIDMTYI